MTAYFTIPLKNDEVTRGRVKITNDLYDIMTLYDFTILAYSKYRWIVNKPCKLAMKCILIFRATTHSKTVLNLFCKQKHLFRDYKMLFHYGSITY